ncbi:MAG: extracellular solute-binding protein [Alphaproteobacteria bacterium]|nr:extracellular solute-binding protein [Alphaproteobacteria bacterium]
MKKIIRNSFFLLSFFCSQNVFSASSEIVISDHISMYGDHKYKTGFKNFDYINPHAPKGGRIVLPAYGGFDNFNPFILKGIAPSEIFLTLDTLGYTPLDDETTVYPLIAKQFELPKDKSFVGFILNEKAKFSNGTKITADDIVFTYNNIIEKGSPLYRVYYADIDHVEKISDHHVRFIYKEEGKNNRELPLILSGLPVYSKKDWKEKDFAKTYLSAPLGSGPYLLQRFEAGKYLIFKRNPNYWAKDLPSRKGFYNFDEIRYDYYQDTTVTLQALFSGNIDAREEYIAKNWATAYDNDIVNGGKIIKAELLHNNAATLQNFAFNIRRDKFKDKKVRQAINLAFNFDWANENLFYNQYQRLYSYFTNSGMEATGLPQGKELKILKKYQTKLDPEIFTKEPSLPRHKNFEETRETLRQAVTLLNHAGYDFVDGKMTFLQTGTPLRIEILSNSVNGSVFTRVMLPFIENLRKIGIEATFRNLEMNVFKNRLDTFDYDMVILSFPVSRTPGNEQREYWGSKNANTKGSYNKIGIQNEIVDELITKVIQAQTKEDYVASVKALDRVLLNEQYMIFQWYSPSRKVAYWNKFDRKKTETKTGYDINTWWIKE